MGVGDYINYRFKALTRHGVHSPLIYNLQDTVFIDRQKYSIYGEMEKVLRKLKVNKALIHLTDLGAGSRKPAKVKTVGNIARHAVQRKKYRELLFRMVRKYRPKTVIELGTSLGVTTCYLNAGLDPDANLYSLEGDPVILDFAVENVLPKSRQLITVLGNFDQTLPALLAEIPKVDFVYLDGNHTYEATKRYFNMLVPYLSENAILVFDDIYWSDGMKKAWVEIVNDTRSQFTVDLFQLGIVFFTPARVKQHFVLLY